MHPLILLPAALLGFLGGRLFAKRNKSESPLPGVNIVSWERFVAILASAPKDAVSPNNKLGTFQMNPSPTQRRGSHDSRPQNDCQWKSRCLCRRMGSSIDTRRFFREYSCAVRCIYEVCPSGSTQGLWIRWNDRRRSNMHALWTPGCGTCCWNRGRRELGKVS